MHVPCQSCFQIRQCKGKWITYRYQRRLVRPGLGILGLGAVSSRLGCAEVIQHKPVQTWQGWVARSDQTWFGSRDRFPWLAQDERINEHPRCARPKRRSSRILEWSGGTA